MMRALLAKKAALNMTKRVTAEGECTIDGITCYYGVDSQTKCINAQTDAYFFPTPITVKDSNGQTTSGVYIVAGGCYLATSGSLDNYEYLQLSEEGKDSATSEYYFVSKKEADLHLKADYEVDYEARTSSGELVQFYVYNPKKFTAEGEGDDDYYIDVSSSETDKDLTKDNKIVENLIYAHFYIDSVKEPEGLKVTMSSSKTVTIKGNDPGDFPQKTWKIKAGLYTKDTPDDDLPGGGLSGGAIAGIVIACVVVVGVIVFCVVWFVVLKKPCCCGKGGDAASA